MTNTFPVLPMSFKRLSNVDKAKAGEKFSNLLLVIVLILDLDMGLGLGDNTLFM